MYAHSTLPVINSLLEQIKC